MRQITGAAGVNLASVNYHFGSKESLVQAVLKRRLAVLNSERMRLLDELEAQAEGKPLKPSQIVDAFFGTLRWPRTRSRQAALSCRCSNAP